MKKIFLGLFISLALIACDKNTIQQTTDSIKHADSLFTKANDGLKTLDSISKTINDSDGIAKKVIIPEIQKQKKVIDSTIKSGGWQIDSINKEIEKITKHVVVGTDVVKTLDSANDALNNGESAIKVLTRTADKIFKQTKRQTSSSNSTQNNGAKSQEQNNHVVIPPVVEKNPLVKNAKLEIEVEDLQSAKAILKQRIRENNADLVSENFSQTEGFQREYVTAKVPLQNFDQLVGNLSSQIGEVRSKEMTSEGIDYQAGQLCDVEITLVQNEKTASAPVITQNDSSKPDSFGSKSSNAFMDGFKVLGTVMLAILPFWPLFIIAGLIWYFVRRNKRNKESKVVEKIEPVSNQEPFQKEVTTAEIIETKEDKNNDPPDYSKYLPKE